MNRRNLLGFGLFSLAVLVLTAFAPVASAGVVGELSFANCSGQGVNVTLTTVDWLPVGTGTGCIDAGSSTTIKFEGGSGLIAPGEAGTVNDLGLGTGNSKFIQFAGVYFDAPIIGPGVSNTTCAATYDPGLSACSVGGGPFILSASTSGTIISLTVSGLAYDSTGIGTPWSGVFSTQIQNQTPAQIATTELGGGTIDATFSFDGQSGVPEPVSMALIGGGLLALAGLKRWRA
jgi:hypothetical protein